MSNILHWVWIILFSMATYFSIACTLVAIGKLLIEYYFKKKEDFLKKISGDSLTALLASQEREHVN